MLPSQSPFPAHWWGTHLIPALDHVRPDVGTYGRYEYDRLPPLPFQLRGDFEWLATARYHERGSIREYKAAENAAAYEQLKKSSERLGVPLPESFTSFMERRTLHDRIRSATDCYLYLSSQPVPSPLGGAHLVRFLADSQGCIFWYLYVTPGGSDHAVVATPDYYGSVPEDWQHWQHEPPMPEKLVFAAESFEAFLCRFWLENVIYLADYRKEPMPKAAREYVEAYAGMEAQGTETGKSTQRRLDKKPWWKLW